MEYLFEDDVLKMDYRVLRRYTEEAVLKNPALLKIIRQLNLKELYESDKNPAPTAKMRCISAYIGVPDPQKKFMED